MKLVFNVWVLLGALVSSVFSQSSYNSDHLVQDTYSDPDERVYHPRSSRHQLRSYQSVPHEDAPSHDPRHYQSLEPRYHKREPESYARQPQYHAAPQHVRYHQPEDPSYHRPQEIVYHQSPEHYQEVAPRREQSYHGPSHYQEVREVAPRPEQPYHGPSHNQEVREVASRPEQPYHGSSHYQEAGEKEESKYSVEEPKYTQPPRRSPSSHPAPVPTDPKLPLYFTMYEKRVIQDPMDKYGKGPWRYLTYGHGITYGSKEPGKVFEKGYGYIRALGRDHCKLPEHLCPAKDEKPFDYEGRKEPYFGYRPH